MRIRSPGWVAEYFAFSPQRIEEQSTPRSGPIDICFVLQTKFTRCADFQSASCNDKRAVYLRTDHSGLKKIRGPGDVLSYQMVDGLVYPHDNVDRGFFPLEFNDTKAFNFERISWNRSWLLLNRQICGILEKAGIILRGEVSELRGTGEVCERYVRLIVIHKSWCSKSQTLLDSIKLVQLAARSSFWLLIKPANACGNWCSRIRNYIIGPRKSQ